MSSGSNPAAQAADAAERQHRASPAHQHAPYRDGYAAMRSPLTVDRLASANAPETSSRQAPLLPPSTGRLLPPSTGRLLPPISSLMDERRPGLPPPAAAPSGPGPPSEYPPTSFASTSRSDSGPAPFSDSGRHPRAPPPAPLRIEPTGGEYGREASLHRGSGRETYRQPPSPRRQEAGSAYSSYHRNGANGYAPAAQQTLPPSSGPPSSGSYPPPVQLPPGQFPLPSMSAPASPRDHASTRRSPYTHVPPPPYSQAAQAHVGPNHDAYDYRYVDSLNRIKTITESFTMFAEHYLAISREQNGGQPLLDRVPKENEMRTLKEQAIQLQGSLNDIANIVQQSAAQSERMGASHREDKDAGDMALYETHSHTLQPHHAQAHAHGQTQQHQQSLHHQPPHAHLMHPQQHQQQHPPHQQHAIPPHQQLSHHQMAPPRQATTQSQMAAYPLSDHKTSSSKRRGRAAPPGKCHSCHRVDTPEWRRGPDGARTLCNACGLHFAKLQRKDAMAAKAQRQAAGGAGGDSASAASSTV